VSKQFNSGSIEDTIDIKEIFNTIKYYKWSILFFISVFIVLASLYAYFKPNLYKASATVIISSDGKKGSANSDFMSAALGGGPIELDDEFALLKSRYLASKALENIQIGVRYYTIDKYREVELYKNTPFIISPKYIKSSFFGKKIELIPQSSETFILSIKPGVYENIKNKLYKIFDIPTPNLLKFERVYRYDENITTPWFKIKVKKIFEPTKKSYKFSIVPNQYMYGFVQSRVEVAPLSNYGSIIRVSFKDNVPFRAKEIVDAIINAYSEEKVRQKSESANRTLSFIDSQLEAIHKSLKESASRLQNFKATHIVMDVRSKAATTASKLSEIEAKLYEINTQINILDSLMAYMKSEKDINGIDMSSAQIVGPVISSLIAKLQNAVSLRSTLLIDYTELHPDVIKVTEQINRLRQMLEDSIKSTLKGFKIRKNELVTQINKYKHQLKSLPQEEQRLTQLSRDFMVNEKIYSYLLQKRAETAIIEASKVSDVQVLDSALIPNRPVEPKRDMIIAIGLLLGIFIGITQAFIRKYLDNTIKSVEDIRKLTDLPVYGVLPNFEKKKIKSIYHESMRVIRTNLEFLVPEKKSKIITVTSTMPQEGKTATVINLAKIIAISEKRVIVLDLDMRKPKIDKFFNLDNSEGVSTVLSGRSVLKNVIKDTKNKNLDIVTSGPIPPNPSELLMSTAFKELLLSLRGEYDYVILDSPPIGLVTDAMIAMKESDINLIVLRAGYSKKDFIKTINNFIEEHNLQAGIILNGVLVDKKNYAYGYGYGSNMGHSLTSGYY